jgi:hypothetical protein
MGNHSSGNPNSNSVSCGSVVVADAWLGGDGEIDFTTVSFSGGLPTLSGETFTQLVLNPEPDAGGVGSRLNDNSTSSALGRYLIITGALSGYKDAFKVSGIAADEAPPPNGNDIPVPGSAALLALALLALTLVSARRRPAAASR